MNSGNFDCISLKSSDIWCSMEHEDCVVKFIGLSKPTVKKLITDYKNNIPLNRICINLYQENSFFAFILKKNNEIFSAVDPTRTYPISYKRDCKNFGIGKFDLLCDYASIPSDDNDIDMFLSSGYFLGEKTIFMDIASIPAGKYLIYKDNKYLLEEYHKYNPKLFNHVNKNTQQDNSLDELDKALNVSIKNTIEKANGKRIILSLSAGLDSRLILSKLLEFKYDNIECISWGPLGNGDASGAAKIAAMAGVHWSHIETDKKFCRSIFWSEIRKEFWKYSFNGVSIPNFQEFFVLCKLCNHELYKPDNVLLVNGQSGDFNSGGHLPEITNVISSDHLIDNFMQKHFGLFPKLLNSSDFLNNVKSKLEMDYAINSNDIKNLIYALDVFEFYERQSKWVINGQRSADFFGYSWDLPLWHSSVVSFFEQLDYPLRLNQSCFKSYIKNYDPINLFQSEINRPKWTGLSSMVIPVARAIGLLFGPKAKDNTYKYFAYYGINQDQFSVYELLYFLQKATSLRNCISMHTLTFLDEFSKFGISGLTNKKEILT